MSKYIRSEDRLRQIAAVTSPILEDDGVWERVVEVLIEVVTEGRVILPKRAAYTHVNGNCGATGLRASNAILEKNPFSLTCYEKLLSGTSYYRVTRNDTTAYIYCGSESTVISPIVACFIEGRGVPNSLPKNKPSVGWLDKDLAAAVVKEARSNGNSLTTVTCRAHDKSLVIVVPAGACSNYKIRQTGVARMKRPTTSAGKWMCAAIPDRHTYANMGGIGSPVRAADTKQDAANMCLNGLGRGETRYVSGVSLARTAVTSEFHLGAMIYDYSGSKMTSYYLNTEAWSWTEIAPELWCFNTAPNLLNRTYGSTMGEGASYMCIVHRGDSPPHVNIERVRDGKVTEAKCKKFPLKREE